MKPWILYAVMTVLAWGVWWLQQAGIKYARPRKTLIFQAVRAAAFGLVVLSMERFHIEWSPRGFGWSAGVGFVNFMGFLAFFAAVEKGKVSTVIAMSSLYPVVTIALSVLFLREKISAQAGESSCGAAAGLGCGSMVVACCPRRHAEA
jgi:transporter family protein